MSSGDWNSDGFVDLLIGAYGVSNTGATYMILGHNGTWVTSTSASGVGTNVSGVKLIGDSDSQSGNSVSFAGGCEFRWNPGFHHWCMEMEQEQHNDTSWKELCCDWKRRRMRMASNDESVNN